MYALSFVFIIRFAAAVRWLIGPQLGINMNSPTVECIILSGKFILNSDMQAKKIIAKNLKYHYVHLS